MLASLTPATVALGAPSFTLHVHGTGFADGAVIVFAGRTSRRRGLGDRGDDRGRHGRLGRADTVPVVVRGVDSAASNALSFTFTAAR